MPGVSAFTRQTPGPPRIAVFATVLATSLLGTSTAMSATPPSGQSLDSYLELPLSQLLDMEISLAARKPQKVQDAANAVFVISAEDIRRSGASSIPDLLRMVPGLSVARINTSSWAVTSRGFNGAFSNKLLVLMDGRSVYTPAFSGVYWDVQDTLLEDIERIEVIRGPGATLWGANAVNGIINIVTRSARDTVGGLASLNLGDEQRTNVGARYGWALGDGAVRAYVKSFDLDAQKARGTDVDAYDGWDAVRGGFRFDRQSARGDQWTVMGDVYDSRPRQAQLIPGLPPVKEEISNRGWNLIARWQRPLADDGTSLHLQAYLDQTDRDEASLGQNHQTIDLDFQHRFLAGAAHDLVWGLAYRAVRDDFDSTVFVGADPSSKTTRQYSAFVQDDMILVPERLRLIAGTKIEHNEYSGNEIQPNLRLAWTPSAAATAWAGVSRAVRSPSRIERTGRIIAGFAPGPIPRPIYVFGSDSVDSEELIAYEAGYRRTLGSRASMDVALFHHRYKRLRGNDYTDYPERIQFVTDRHARSDGLEVALDWHPSDWWENKLAYSAQSIRTDVAGSTFDPTIADTRSQLAATRSTPYQQVSLRSHVAFRRGWSVDAWLRHVGEIRARSAMALDIPSYTTLDLRLAWQLNRTIELSLVGQNLFDSQHPEFEHEALVAPTEIERSVFARLRLEF